MPQWLAVTLFLAVVLVVGVALARAGAPRPGGPARRAMYSSPLQIWSIAVLAGGVVLIISLAGPYPSAMFLAVAVGAVALFGVLWWARRSPRP